MHQSLQKYVKICRNVRSVNYCYKSVIHIEYSLKKEACATQHVWNTVNSTTTSVFIGGSSNFKCNDIPNIMYYAIHTLQSIQNIIYYIFTYYQIYGWHYET